MEHMSALIGFFRYVRARILKRDVEVVGMCRLCGNCCRGVLLKDRERWIKTEKQFEQLCEDSPGHTRFKIIDKNEEGYLGFACTMLGEDNLCSCHEERLDLCRDYPSKALYYQGGWTGDDCGFSFKPVTFRDILFRRKPLRANAFENALRKEQNNRQS